MKPYGIMKEHNCTKCDLCISRKQVVKGTGAFQSDIMLIGEAPGYYEDKLGIPFCGQAGTHLTKYLKAANMPRENIYITNICKCRPPYNRTPTEIESYICSRLYLTKEIQTLKPKLVLLLGNTALRTITNNSYLNVTSFDKWFKMNSNIWYLATVHPSAALRNKEYRPKLYQDFIRFAEVYKQLINPFHKINYEVEKEIIC